MGFHGKENGLRLINMHRNLVSGFFRNARGMLRVNGEIHVNHKTTIPFCFWNLKELGTQKSLVLIERVAFKKDDYPGYHNKRGSGSRCDMPFRLGECCTFKFIFFPTAKRVTKEKNLNLPFTRPRELVESPIYVPQQPNTFDFMHSPSNMNVKRSRELVETPRYAPQQLKHPPSNFIPRRSCLPRCMGSLPTVSVSMECLRIFRGYFEYVKRLGGHDGNASDHLHEAVRLGYERYVTEEPEGLYMHFGRASPLFHHETRVGKRDACGS